MDKTVTLMVTIAARPGRGTTLRGWLAALAELSRQDPGNLFYVAHEVEGDPELLVVYERWADQASLDTHMRQPHLTKFLDEAEALLAAPIKGLVCHELALPLPMPQRATGEEHAEG